MREGERYKQRVREKKWRVRDRGMERVGVWVRRGKRQTLTEREMERHREWNRETERCR